MHFYDGQMHFYHYISFNLMFAMVDLSSEVSVRVFINIMLFYSSERRKSYTPRM